MANTHDHELRPSAHSLIGLQTTATSSPARHRTYTNLKKADWTGYRQEIKRQLSSRHLPTDCQKDEKLFRATLLKAVSHHIPTGRRKLYTQQVPAEILTMMEERDDLRKQDPASPRLSTMNDEITKATSDHKRRQWREFVESIDHRTDSTKLWRTIKGIDGKSKQTEENEGITFTGRPHTSPKMITNSFNRQFTTSKLGKHNEFLSPTKDQHGFRPRHSTTSALLQLTTNIEAGFNQRKPPHRTVCVAIDLTAAFDTVSHDTLISKIAGSSLPPALTRWLSCYLRGRQAATSFKDTKPSTRIVRTGIPQGSKLSPSLFNYYIQGSHRNLIMNFHDFSMTICYFSMTFDHQLNSFATTSLVFLTKIINHKNTLPKSSNFLL